MQPDAVPSSWSEQLAAGRWLFAQAGYPPHLSVDPAVAEVLVRFWAQGRTPRQVLDDRQALLEVAEQLFYGPEPEDWHPSD